MKNHLTFASLARFSCMSHLRLSHLHFSQEGVLVTFPVSKTDQLGLGQKTFIKRVPGSTFCPVLLLKAYTLRLLFEAYRTNALPYSGFLFPALRAQNGLSRLQDAAFSHQGATKAMRDLLCSVGVATPAAYSLHSGRRGGATAAAMNGCDFLSIKRQGRWKSDSCPQIYIDEAYMRQNDFSMYLGLI